MSFVTRLFTRAGACGTVLLLVLLASSLAIPSDAAAAAEGPETAGRELIVRFKSDTTAGERQDARSDADTKLQRALLLPRAQLLRVHGRSVSSAVRTLERDADVDYAEPNGRVHALAAAPNDPRFGELWGLSSVRATTAWDTTRGSGQVVAVVDTGVQMSHPDLAADIWSNPGESTGPADGDGNGKAGDLHGWDFVGNDADPTDQNGHGSHVAGTIAAVAGNGVGVAGVAPQAKVMPVRVLDAEGSGSYSDVVDGIVYAADEGAGTINLSLGGPDASQTLSNAIDTARSKGAVVVAAAGNDGMDNDGANPEYPCIYPQANLVCVAAIDQSGALASFSNYGATTVDVAAPGVGILSTVSSSYASWSGTSMATPHVSAIAALVRAAVPGASADGVGAAIRSGAVSQANLNGRVASGGHADAPRAIEAAEGTPATTPPPSQSKVPAPAISTAPASPVSSPAPAPSAGQAPPRPACAGLHGRRLARCKLDLKVKRVCGRRHGRARRVCAKRVRAMARCKTLKHGTRAQRHRRSSCMRKARAIGRKHHR